MAKKPKSRKAGKKSGMVAPLKTSGSPDKIIDRVGGGKVVDRGVKK